MGLRLAENAEEWNAVAAEVEVVQQRQWGT